MPGTFSTLGCMAGEGGRNLDDAWSFPHGGGALGSGSLGTPKRPKFMAPINERLTISTYGSESVGDFRCSITKNHFLDVVRGMA